MSGGGGDDFLDGGVGIDVIDGGAGFDTVSFAESLFGVTADLAAGTASDGLGGDTLTSIEDIIGSRGDDLLLGSAVDNFILGADGADRIDGRDGNDVLRGERGNDVMTGGAGNDAFLFSRGDGADVVQDFAAGDTLEIYGYAAAQSISQIGADVVLILSATDRVTLNNTQVATVQAAVTFSPAPLGNVAMRPDQTLVTQGGIVINEGMRLVIDDPAPILSGRDVSAIGVLLADSSGGSVLLRNAGTISLQFSGSSIAYGIRSEFGAYSNSVVNYATGVIDIVSDQSSVRGIHAVSSAWNLGTMNVTSLAGDAVAFQAQWLISNIGALHIQANGRALGTTTLGSSYTADQIFNSGTIVVEGGARSAGFEFISGAHPTASNSWLVNRGTITVTDSTDTQDSAGIMVSWAGNADLYNSGTITGEYSIRTTYHSSYGYTGMLTIYNSGSLIGDVYLVGGEGLNHRATIVNTGQIQGDVDLGGANDIYDGRQGIVSGTIRGNEGNDQLLGGSGAEAILGGFGDDLLSGGAGNDRLTGGVGADTFRYEAGFGTDTITDFVAGTDQIHVRGYTNWSSIQQVGTDVVVTFAPGTVLILANQALANISAANFTFGVAAIAERVMPTSPLPTPPPFGATSPVATVSNDFNGDGRSDVLWRNDNGQMSNWLGTANGGWQVNDSNAGATIPTSWHIVGTGDFNGDGRDDILWRNENGLLSNWLGTAAGGFTPNDANAHIGVPTSWQVAGVGDFNGDGRDDILWRNVDGQLSSWLGTAIGGWQLNDANAAATVPTNWHVIDTGDFNGDGRADILWRNDAGEVSNWLGTVTGGFTSNDANAFAGVPNAWSIAGIGDFNGDGRDDILWRHAEGQMSNWLGTASGGWSVNDANAATAVPVEWQVHAIGDYNGDGRDDILWRNVDGQLSNWLGTASGGYLPNGAVAGTSVPTAWHVQPEDPWI